MQNSGRDLEDRAAIITGGARGIGRACAERFLEAGARWVAIADLDRQEGERCAAELDPKGERVIFRPTDITRRQDVDAMAQWVLDRAGRIDILVNNAGIAGRQGTLETQSEEDLDRIWAINVKGTCFTCQAVHAHMVSRGYGRIINIASIAGKEGNPGLAPYSMTKAAVIGLTKAYAKEVAQTGILVNCIAPAVVETEILKQVSDAVRAYMIAKIPMGRVGQPRELAELALFLASERCSFSTGFCYDLSGGRATY